MGKLPHTCVDAFLSGNVKKKGEDPGGIHCVVHFGQMGTHSIRPHVANSENLGYERRDAHTNSANIYLEFGVSSCSAHTVKEFWLADLFC